MSLSISISKNDIYQSSQDKLEVVKAEINGMLEKNFNTLHMVANQPAVGDFDLNSAKNILVGAANVNSDLVIALDNAQGEQVAKSNDDAFTNVSEREFFQQAMNGNEKYVSDILISKVTGKSNVVISTPVRDRNNKIVGALQASTELSKISDFVARLSQDGTKVYVLSRQGIVIAHPNIEYVENQEDFSALEFVQAGLSGNNTTLRTKNIQGEDVIVSHALNELSGWLIVVETPFSVAMSSAFNLLNVAVILFVAVAVIVGLLGLYFSKRFTAPLVELSSIIQTIADGDLKDFEVKFNSKDEIGQVFNSLKSMITNLRRLVGSIQTVASTVASHSL
jgi:methyl-accepting chemotaxis protein